MASARKLWTRMLGSAVNPTAAKSSSSKQRLAGWTVEPVSMSPYRGIVLGVDPSVRGTGLAVLDWRGQSPRLLESRTLRIPSKVDFFGCLAVIHREVIAIMERHQIGRTGIEETVYVQNHRTSLKLACARGAALGPIAAAGIAVVQLAPTDIKKGAAATGSASKEQVQAMVSRLLGCELLAPDEADAAAAAIACCRASASEG